MAIPPLPIPTCIQPPLLSPLFSPIPPYLLVFPFPSKQIPKTISLPTPSKAYSETVPKTQTPAPLSH